MDDSTSESVKEVFGTDFQQYCLRHKILIRKDKSGTFMVSNVTFLTECINILAEHKLNVNIKIEQVQVSRPFPTVSNRLRKQRKTKKKICEKNVTDVANDSYFANLNLQIYLYDTTPILPNYTVHPNLMDYILNTAKDGNEIYDFIINETMTRNVIVDYESSIPLISPLLKQMQKQHKKFHYSSIVKHLGRGEDNGRKLKCEYEVTIEQLRFFFNLVFTKVVPLKIFGKLKNLKRIKKAMTHLLTSPRLKAFNLLPYIEKLDISCITWLQNVQNVKTQWLIVAKFVKWFFTGFLIKVLRIHFHLTSFSTSNERLYVRRSDWRDIQKKYIKQKLRSNTLQPDIECKEWNPPIGVYKLRLKPSTVRPIFVSQHQQPNEKKNLNTIFKFLRQLYTTEYGLHNFRDEWKSIVHHKRKSETGKTYLVSCDVKDAFGSIKQGQLYDIIQSLCEKLPETLILRSYALKNRNRMDPQTLCYREFFCDPNLQLPLSPGTLYACIDSKNCRLVKKRWLLEKIWKYIFYQRVKIRKTIYIIGKGIVQGTMLSPILSDIYYTFVLNKEMLMFLNSGKLTRYMDDILYTTENEVLAKEFLELIKTGIPEYNCWFKELKTQCNIICGGITAVNSINYIGYKINCNTLEIEPRDADTRIRYLISLYLKNGVTPLQLFKKRLDNMASLKLSKFVLDNTINSKATIMRLLQRTCLLQANRAYVLIQELFHDVHENVGNILRIIRTNNMKVAKHIIRMILKLEEKMDKVDMYIWNKRILCTLRTCYKKVFKNDKTLRKYFIRTYTR